MQQDGEYVVPADVEVVWQALNDVDMLGRCIPGCESIERIDDTHFEAVVRAKIGPVSAPFRTKLELQDVNAPTSYTIVGDVQGGAAGFGKGEAAVQLETVPEGTRLSYQVQGKVGGKLAQVGSRLVDGATRKLAGQFFSALSEALGGEQAAEPASASASEADASVDETRPYQSGDQWKIWVIAFAVIALAMLLAR